MLREAEKPIPVIHIRDDETTPTFPVFIGFPGEFPKSQYTVTSSTTFGELLEKFLFEVKYPAKADLDNYSFFYPSNKMVQP